MTTKWDSANKSAGIAISGGGMIATLSTGSGGQEVMSDSSKSSGKFYAEFTMPGSVTNTGSVGVADTAYIVVPTSGAGANNAKTTTCQRFGYVAADGGLYINLGGGNYDGHVVCMAIDVTAHKIWFRYDGGDWNGNASYDPGTGTGGLTYTGGGWPSPGPLHLYAQLANNPDNVTLNVGETPFAQTAPTGFAAWDPGAVAAQKQPVLIINQ